jgi:hypothetical protein
VIELRSLAHGDGALSRFFSEPPEYLSPNNGVTGMSLAYNPTFVSAVESNLKNPLSVRDGTVEYSAYAAAALAATAGAVTAPSFPEPSGYNVQEILTQWRDISERRYGHVVKPIQIEVTVGPGFPERHAGREAFRDYEGYPIVLRRAKKAKLHFAESGGRLVALQNNNRSWGTLGGFLLSAPWPIGQKLPFEWVYGATAGHVVEVIKRGVCGTPAFTAAANFGVSRVLQRLTSSRSTFVPRSWRPALGVVEYLSPPNIVAPFACSAASSPDTNGLDLAVVRLEQNDYVSAQLRFANEVEMGEISQVLQGRFAGARSGTVAVRVTSYSVWQSYEVDFPDAEVGIACVGDCLQIALARRPYVWTDVSRRGDSGAWIVADSAEGPRWVGMLIGGDGERSGVVPAHRIMQHLRSRFGAMLPAI